MADKQRIQFDSPLDALLALAKHLTVDDHPMLGFGKLP